MAKLLQLRQLELMNQYYLEQCRQNQVRRSQSTDRDSEGKAKKQFGEIVKSKYNKLANEHG